MMDEDFGVKYSCYLLDIAKENIMKIMNDLCKIKERQDVGEEAHEQLDELCARIEEWLK